MSKVKRNIPPLNPKVFKEVQRMSDEFLADFTSSLHEAKEREERKKRSKKEEEWVGKLPEIDLHNPDN